MKNKLNLYRIWGALCMLVLFQSCGKEWLEAKPDKSLVVPSTVKDFQLLLDNSMLFNMNQSCGLGEIGAGDFYVPFSAWQSLFNVQEKSAYVWAPTKNFYNNEQSFDWVNGYQRILAANVILNGIEKLNLTLDENKEWHNVKGAALFFRAFDFFNLAQEYCVNYNIATASNDLGLPLRLEYDVNIPSKRSSVEQTYDRIITDLNTAANLLSPNPAHKTRPSKEATFALLAKTYLVMGNYEQAGYYANLVLQIQNELLDYSKLNSNASFPIGRFNSEVIFQSVFSYAIFNASRLTVEPDLFDAYSAKDCRQSLFFKANESGMTFKGSYNGDKNLFGGLAVDEIYLIRAEARARNGELKAALSDLNHLRKNRYMGKYQDLMSADPKMVLDYILLERRKELVFRGIRWSDLRRLNTDSRYAVTLSRVLAGVTYTLKPNDKRYVFPIDDEEIRLSGIQQNER